jgi:acetyltransferase-like isoleucine patch superfamily enzyme
MTGMKPPTEKLDDVPREIFDRSRSARAKYQALMVGRPGWGPLLRYELVITLAGRLPGALGLFLRSKLYPGLFARCGRNVFFGADIVLRHPHKISIGNDVVIDDGCVLDAKGTTNQGITIGDGVFLGRHTSLNTKDGNIVLEDRVNIGPFCTVFSGSSVRIGRETLLAAYAYLVGGGHAFDESGTPILDQPRPSRGITVGPSSWIGTAVTVLDGVSIGRGVVVGANAVVTRNLPDMSVAAGTPAVVQRTREESPASSS